MKESVDKNSRLLLFLVASSFGFYVFPSFGIRLEQLFIYLTFILVTIFRGGAISIHRCLSFTILLLFFALFVPFISLIYYQRHLSTSLVFAQVENYLQPIVVLILFSVALLPNYDQIYNNFRRVLFLFVNMMSLHTLFMVLMKLSPDLHVWRQFTGEQSINELGMNAAQLSLIGGRLSGLFTQVFEAGFAYSLALLSLVYLVRTGHRLNRFYLYSIYFLILSGGLLTFSKLFIIGSLVCMIVAGFVSIALVTLTVFALAQVLSFLFDLSSGFLGRGTVYLDRLINIREGSTLFETYTSGRFSENSAIIQGIREVLEDSPVLGHGYGSIVTSDFSLFEVVKLGGLLGLVIYCLLCTVLVGYTLRICETATRRFFLGVHSLVLLASLSAPALTANRISVIIWVLFGFSVIFGTKLVSRPL